MQMATLHPACAESDKLGEFHVKSPFGVSVTLPSVRSGFPKRTKLTSTHQMNTIFSRIFDKLRPPAPKFLHPVSVFEYIPLTPFPPLQSRPQPPYRTPLHSGMHLLGYSGASTLIAAGRIKPFVEI